MKCPICKQELKEDEEICNLCMLKSEQITRPMAYTKNGQIMIKLPSDENSQGESIHIPRLESRKQVVKKPKIIKRDGRKIGHLIWMEK